MESQFHKIDPDGDTLLILKNPNAPFAPLEPPPPPPARRPTKKRRKTKSPVKPEVRMQLSSRHLTLASGYFRRLMAHEWKEATTGGDYAYVVNAEDWDEKALLLMMMIIHGKTADLPTIIDLEMLAKIITLVDYYQCHEAVKFFHNLWLRPIEEVNLCKRDLLLLLSVACVFPHPELFERLTKDLLDGSEEPIASLGLPIPQRAIDDLNETRQYFISNILAGLKALIEAEFTDNGLGCSFDCSSSFVGALSKGMDTLRISDKYLTPPYTGHSLRTLLLGILQFREPSWSNFCRHRNSYTRRPCSLSAHTEPLARGQFNRVAGLKLGHYVNLT